MQFSVGYRLPAEHDSMVDVIRDHRAAVAECYFALPGDPSGRGALALRDGAIDEPAACAAWDELAAIAALGVRPVLLFNAACYGREATSRAFGDYVVRSVGELRDWLGLDCVTTTSPFVAEAIRARFSGVELRASVNMRLYSVAALASLEASFDSFYAAKELNRDLPALRRMKAWCGARGKRLHLLANSGCLYHCPWQTDHDNRVAHESEIAAADNMPRRYPSPCWELMERPESQLRALQNAWIRPEDIDRYAEVADGVKLATRQHDDPRRVVEAYARRRCEGNLLALFEPSYVPVMGGVEVVSSRFPDDWFDTVSACGHACESCGYCRHVWERVATPRYS